MKGLGVKMAELGSLESFIALVFDGDDISLLYLINEYVFGWPMDMRG